MFFTLTWIFYIAENSIQLEKTQIYNLIKIKKNITSNTDMYQYWKKSNFDKVIQ